MKEINAGDTVDNRIKTIKDKSISPRNRNDLMLSTMDNH